LSFANFVLFLHGCKLAKRWCFGYKKITMSKFHQLILDKSSRLFEAKV
jgi:hypothetical protein